MKSDIPLYNSYESYNPYLSEPSDQEPSILEKVTAWFTNIGRALVRKLTEGREPQIWTITDADGQIWWNGYDPISGKATYFNSEDEIRSWIDQLYYRKPEPMNRRDSVTLYPW